MVKVVLLVGDPGDQWAEALKHLRACLGLEYSRIREAIRSGQPIAERKLYDRNDEEFPERLVKLFKQLESRSVPYESYAMTDSQTLAQMEKSILLRLNSAKLRDLINDRKESMKYQRTIAELQDPES